MLERLRLASRSLAGKFLALAVIFLTVPVILYAKFADADAQRQAFLLRSLQAQGRLAAMALEPVLARPGPRALLDANAALGQLASDQINVKLLLRPANRAEGFFLVAATPALDTAGLIAERERLDQAGVLPRLGESCAGDRPLALRYAGSSGREELLTSLSPVHNAAGCWVIITSYAAEALAGSSLDRPFSRAPEVQLAMAFYGLMAVLIAMAAAGMLLDLRAFVRLARAIRQGGRDTPRSFTEVAAIPELRPVAREFDRMVTTLDASARALREAAEDNAHAFKAPIAVVTQALEPLRRAAGQDERAARAVGLVEQALVRLGGLVNAARHLDEEAAALMDARLQPVDLAALASQMAASFDRAYGERGIRVVAQTPGPARVLATAESLETVIENLLDNAIGFSPAGGAVTVTVVRKDGEVALAVADQGPGVPEGQMGHIFRRSFSYRPGTGDGASHSGIGLAVVRRTVELLGGTAHAENLPGAGLRVTLLLPAA